ETRGLPTSERCESRSTLGLARKLNAPSVSALPSRDRQSSLQRSKPLRGNHESAKRQNRSPNLAAGKARERERTPEKIPKPIRVQKAARELAAEYLLPHSGTRPLVVGGDVRRGKADARGGGVPSLSLL